jgi:sugar lactone lactonase YvrE
MSDKIIEAELEFQIDAHLGEGPVWDELKGKLYWVDILSGLFHEYDPKEKTNKSYEIGEHIGAAVPREKGGFILAMKSGFATFDPDSGKITPITDPEEDKPGNRFNDGKCDPAGRFWAGTMAYDLTKGAGSLYCMSEGFNLEHKLDGITISNGLAWNRAADRFYHIDSPTGNIYAYQYDNETGELSGRRIVRHITDDIGFPDGMTIDREDKLWVAIYGGSRVLRIDPKTGETLMEIHLPVPKITSCTFGGKNLNELYITTCREYMSKDDIDRAPLSGSLFKVKLPVEGLPVHRFLD